MLADLFEVRETACRGKGIFAKTDIPKGTVVAFLCKNCKVLYAKDEFERLPKKERQKILFHTYRLDDGDVYQDCGYIAKYTNHSCDANMISTEFFDIASRDIKKGEECTIDYRFFNEGEDTEWECRCGSKDCCHTLRCIRPIPKKVLQQWNRKIKDAMQYIKKVPQPILKELLEHYPQLTDLFALTPELTHNAMSAEKSRIRQSSLHYKTLASLHP